MAAKDLGPLDWRTPIVDSGGRPSPEFQRRWNQQRTNNGLIGFVATGSGAPTGAPLDGQEYVDIGATPWVLYVGDNGAWSTVGPLAFTDLADAPHAYTSAGDKLVKVTNAADGLEFASLSAVLDLIDDTQGAVLFRGAAAWVALAPATDGKVLTTHGAAADPTWETPTGGGGGALTLISEVVTSGSQTSVTFSAIPNTYRDLVLVIRGRGTTGAPVIDMRYQINGDSSGNYEYQEFRGTDATTATSESVNQTSAFFGYFPAASATANYGGLIEARFGDYKGTTFFKSVVGSTAFSLGTGGFSQGAGVTSSIWISTAAIASLFVFPSAGGFVDGSVVSLYGSS